MVSNPFAQAASHEILDISPIVNEIGEALGHALDQKAIHHHIETRALSSAHANITIEAAYNDHERQFSVLIGVFDEDANAEIFSGRTLPVRICVAEEGKALNIDIPLYSGEEAAQPARMFGDDQERIETTQGQLAIHHATHTLSSFIDQYTRIYANEAEPAATAE